VSAPWKRFEHKTVFISCSSDMATEVEIVVQVMEELNRRLPEGDRWEVYHWARADATWVANGTWQEYIPCPSDLNVGVVICLLGERLGSPLPDYFPLSAAEIALPPWVRFPWPDDGATQTVPLTGTLFELLDAIQGGQRSGRNQPATLIYVKADGNLFAQKHLAPDQRAYGFEQLYRRLSDGEVRIRDRRVRDDYDTQIDWLDRFCELFLRAAGRPYTCFGTADGGADTCLTQLREMLLRDLPRTLNLPSRHQESRDLKGLEAYQPEDQDILFGRDQEIVRLLQRLSNLAKIAAAPLIVLTGRSGEGKSSVLRAGLVGRLGRGRYPDFGRFHCVLADALTLGTEDPLLRFEEAVNQAIGGQLWKGQHSLSAFRSERRVPELVQAVRDALADMPPDLGDRKSRLFIAIDQAEELLVAAEEDLRVRPGILELLEVLRALAQAGLAWVVITLPTEHLDRLTRFMPDLAAETEVLGRPGDADLLAIIKNSLELSGAGKQVSEKDISSLMADVTQWLSRQEDPGPILPLLSSLVKEEAQYLLFSRDEKPTIDGIINRRCERAWKKAQPRIQDSERALARLLRQLVLTGLREGGALKLLRHCPIDHEAVRQAMPLVEAMTEQRLLIQPQPDVLRLVHISVLADWDRAREWYDGERAHQLVLAELEWKAKLWAEAQSRGESPRLITDPQDIESAVNLWAAWYDDADRLPLNFIRESFMAQFDPISRPESWKSATGKSYLRSALWFNDSVLVIHCFDRIGALSEPERRRVVQFHNPETGSTALQIAAWRGNVDAVRRLLAWGAEADGCDHEGQTPLMSASWAGHYEVANILIERGINVDATDSQGTTALAASASSGHYVITKLLLDVKADPTIADNQQSTALTYAVRYGFVPCVEALLSHPIDLGLASYASSTLLALAAESDYTDIVRLLLDHGARPISDGTSAHSLCMFSVVKNRNVPMADLLIAAGAPINVRNEARMTPLTEAISARNKELVECFLKHGADPNLETDEGTPLCQAVRYRFDEIARMLLQYGADAGMVDEDRVAPLHVACQFSANEIVEALLAAGADHNQEDVAGFTAIARAAECGNVGALSLLLDRGALPNQVSSTGMTPLVAAASGGQSAAVELLLTKGADPNIKLRFGLTPLIMAAQRGCVEVITTLCRGGAEINHRDERNLSALMYAELLEKSEAARTLRDLGGC
jgi:ankyrin repeat protein